MKKIFLSILIIGCLMTMTACGKIDEVSQKMIDDIDSLGIVTIDDDAKVQKLLNTYNTLTDKQKEQVTNYTILLEAQDSIDELIAIKEAEELERQIAEEYEHEKILNIQREYYSIVGDAIANLTQKLKNPSTLNLLEIIVAHYHTEEVSEVNIAIHYTAQNNLGADLDSYFHYIPSDLIGVEVDASTYDSLWRCMVNGEDSYYSIEIADGFYSHGEDLDKNTFGFIIDLDDYNSYK